MSNLKERLDLLREEIQKDDFLDGKGLSNEVNIRIFCYDPAEEMTVTHFLEQIKTDQSLNCRLIECNLYKTFLSICDDLDITDAIPEMEEADGGIFLLEQLHSAIGEGEFIDKIQYEPHKRGDVLMLTGVGDVFGKHFHPSFQNDRYTLILYSDFSEKPVFHRYVNKKLTEI